MAVLLFEDFEDSTVTYTTNVADDLTVLSNSDYFGRLDTDDVTLPATLIYNNTQGTGFFGAQDTDSANPAVDLVILTFTVDITGYTNLEWSGLFAEDDAADGREDWDITSSVRVDYSIDGGSSINLFAIEGTDAVAGNKAAHVDTNFDGVGDGAEITDVFTQYTTAIAGTGSILTLRVIIEDLDTGDEDIAIDNIMITGLCFAAGSRIAGPLGETEVQDLAIGDEIVTATGLPVKVKWIGRQTMMKQFGVPERMEPVRILTGALGGGLPHGDLIVTADHGMILDGLVINASALVNGTTIDWVPMRELPEQVTYYHVETEAHDVILANGAPAETFIDYAGRQAFDNYAEYVELYGAERIIREMDRPRISTRRLLPEEIKARLGANWGAGATAAAGQNRPVRMSAT